MRVSAFPSDAILRLGGTDLHRTKCPGGAAFEPCSTVNVESLDASPRRGSSGRLIFGSGDSLFGDGIGFGLPKSDILSDWDDMKLDQIGARTPIWLARWPIALQEIMLDQGV